MDAGAILVGLALSLVTVPLLHEGSHAGVALVLGARRVRVRVLEGRRLAPRVEAGLDDVTRLGAVCFYGAGPLANLIAALVAFALADESAHAAVVVGTLHLLYGVLNLWPFVEGSDGCALLSLLRRRTPSSS